MSEQDRIPYTGQQPPPRPGRETTAPVARHNFERTFEHQIQKGYEKYGVTLESFNGRDAYQDFLQEQVDGLQYATQLYLEAKTFAALLASTTEILERAALYRGDPDDELRGELRRQAEEIRVCLGQSGLSG